MHKSQILFYFLLAFLAGVLFSSLWPVSQNIILVLVIGAVIVGAVSGYHRTFKQTESGIFKRKLGILIAFLILLFAFGAWRFNTFNLSHSYLGQFADRKAEVNLAGYVSGETVVSGNKAKFKFRVKKIIVPGYVIKTDENILVSTDVFPNRFYGDVLLLAGEPKSPVNFDNFDYVTYLKKEGIRTLISFPEIKEYKNFTPGPFEKTKIWMMRKILVLKDKFQTAINNSIAEPNASFINGILLGSRQNIPEELKEQFNKTSTTHILAISGYNIAVISEALLAIFIFFVRRKTAFWLSLAIIAVFVVLTGASASVVRAAIMGLILSFASGYGRLNDPKNSIVFAAAAMVFINPFVLVFDIGFQLSFLAVLGLAYFYPFLKSKFQKISNIGQIKETVLMTISAQTFVFPLIIYYFQNFSLVSLPANVIVLPLIYFAMFFGLLSGLAGMFSIYLGRLIGVAAWAITAFQIKVIEFFGNLSFSSLTISITLPIMLAIYLALFLFVLKVIRPRA